MSGRVLDFAHYIGGADNVITVEMFKRSKKTYNYSFNQNITGWTFTADMQSILLDALTYDRTTGLPNFTDTNVLGYFDNYATITSPVTVTNATLGEVDFTIPDNRYAGLIFPNARELVVATVVSLEWDYGQQKDAHRYLILERWEPGIAMGNPQNNDGITQPTYVALA